MGITIEEKIQKHLDDKYNTIEKVKTYGEVFTPFWLIREMLDKVPKDVWKNPHETWLDPCAGLGNFHCIVLERLLISLSDWESDIEKRYKHIIEKQLYFIELNPKSVKFIEEIFNPEKKYKMNLVCADSLDPDHPGWDEVGYMWDEDDKEIIKSRREYKKVFERKQVKKIEIEVDEDTELYRKE